MVGWYSKDANRNTRGFAFWLSNRLLFFMLIKAGLTIDLNALIANYQFCATATAPAICAAVIKANAYGLGVERVYLALRQHTACTWFFVVYPQEALQLRELEKQHNLMPAKIVVLCGLCGEDPQTLAAVDIWPAINHLEDLHIWQLCAAQSDRKLPAVLQVNTGMNRIGMPCEQAKTLTAIDGINWQLLMAHYACADDPAHPQNAAQLQAFQKIQAYFPNVKTSLANSAGLHLGADYHGDLVRPGIALYGGQPSAAYQLPLQPVVQLYAPIIQLNDLQPGETVGYSAAFTADRPMRVATLQIGYADGLYRSHSNNSHFYLGTYQTPVLGRISMDVCAVDVSHVTENLVQLGALVEIIGPHRSLEAHAAACGTINYEVLTRLNPRLPRSYLDA